MANVKTRYAEVTRAAKARAVAAAEQSRDEPSQREDRLFQIFRSRAREDFRTLSPSSTSAKPARS